MKTSYRHFILLPIIVIIMAVAFSTSLSAEEIDVGIPVEEHPELFIGRTMPTHGEGKIAVFLIQFPDYKNDNPDATAEYYNKLYFSKELFDSATKYLPLYSSVATFYKEQSYGKLNLSGQVFDWYTAKHERSYYDSYENKKELVMEAIAYYEAQGVDFSKFDGDKNKELDAVIFHFAGPVDTEMDEPWYGGVEYSSHIGKTKTGQEVNSFIQIDNSVNKAAGNAIFLRRTIFHELLHALGMDDLYGRAWFGLTPVDDLVSDNSDIINPYYKMLLGWTEKVTLVTSNVSDIKLNLWEDVGETIIVTNEYNGIFDELYLIACTEPESPEVRIYHVDARLSADGKAFLYRNMTYSPKPDIGSTHGDYSNLSEFLFMEEISAVPQYDRVLNKNPKVNLNFTTGSTLAPNSIPGTDTHDGEYTGIKISDFKIYNKHITMDITFGNKDNDSPSVSDELSILGLVADNKLRFNEYVYPAENWSKIKVTTLSGETIDAKFIHGHYLRHEIGITITGKIPSDGYLIVIPEGCIKDSSGNKNEAQTIAVSSGINIIEQSREFLPWYYKEKDRRWEGDIYTFRDGDDSVFITTTGEDNDQVSIIEFLKTDANGNIITHKFAPNLCEGGYFVQDVLQANDGSYILIFYNPDKRTDCVYLVCISKKGKLRWETAYTGLPPEATFAYENGIVFCDDRSSYAGLNSQHMFLNVETGKLSKPKTADSAPMIKAACYNGKEAIGFIWIPYQNQLEINICDPESMAVKQSYFLHIDGIKDDPVLEVTANRDGTYTIITENTKSQYIVLTVSSTFKVIKQITIDAIYTGGHSPVVFLPDDGFIVAISSVSGNHSNSTFYVARYSKDLNLMWETDIVADYINFTVTKGNKIVAVASYFSPKREAYYLQFGTEDKVEVKHKLRHQSAKAATCTNDGQIEHWICTECGNYFSDAAGKNLLAASDITLSKVTHTPATYANVDPTCTESGLMGGRYCSVCNAALTERTIIPAKGHVEVKEDDVPPTCTEDGYTGGSACSVCNVEIETRKVIPATGHTEIIDIAVEPTHTREGLTQGSHCSVCNEIIIEQQTIAKLEGFISSTVIIIGIATVILLGFSMVAITVIKKHKS